MAATGTAEALTRELVEYARGRGVDLVGCTSAAPFVVGEPAEEIAPGQVMAGARSVVVGACYTYGADSYRTSRPGVPRGRLGPWTRVSVGAYGHVVQVLTEFLEGHGYRSAPGHDLPQKPAAVRSGLASYGRNCIVHAEGTGSYLELAAVVTDAELACTDRPIHTSDCPEDCRACVEACPTGALAEPFRLRREQCICHYMWGAPIPLEHREGVGDLVFRCDACQRVCPHNQGLTPRAEFPFPLQTGEDSPELIPLLLGDERYYREAVPEFVRSAGAETVRRNAAIAAGNSDDPAVVPGLIACLGTEHAPTRIAAAWALGRLGGAEAMGALRARLACEEDDGVREEIERSVTA
jgi:epoxyqueuosine reductase